MGMVRSTRSHSPSDGPVGYCAPGPPDTNDSSNATAYQAVTKIINGADATRLPHNVSAGSSAATVAGRPDDVTDVLQDGHYDWDEYQQGLMLGAYFWLSWTTQTPGGMLARRVGPKLVFGVRNMVAGVMAVLIPLAASLDYWALIAVRVLQGVAAGFAWPSMHCMTANWIPPNDRSKFVSAYLGSSVGAALTFPVCGLIMSRLGWPAVFYATALVSATWFIAWWFLVFDHPHTHPRISRAELTYLQVRVGQDAASYKLATPWLSILTSVPVWMILVVQFAGFWSLFTLLTHAPTYLRTVHGWGIEMVGLLSGVPAVGRTVFSLTMSWLGDYMLKKGAVSRTNLRKIATTTYMVTQALCLVGLAYSGCDSVLAAACLTAAVTVSGAVSVGQLPATVDISPSFCSILLGIISTVSVLPGFISPTIVGMITYQDPSPSRWRVVFLLTAAVVTVPGILFAVFSSAERQPWDPLITQHTAAECEALSAKGSAQPDNRTACLQRTD